jgi:hypothetical protein
MEGVGQPIFAYKIYAQLCTLLEVPGVDNNKLDLFIKDAPFNFTLKQALDSLDDLEALAEVARLQDVITCILIHAEFTKVVQELSKAFNKFQNHINNKIYQLVKKLEVTNGHHMPPFINLSYHGQFGTHPRTPRKVLLAIHLRDG